MDIKKGINDIFKLDKGELTLEQINLIFKHLNMEITFIDENEILKFYSDNIHKVSVRVPSLLGRKIEDCHPSKLIEFVKEVIRAFKANEESEAEFWGEKNGKFIYTIYIALRDENDNYKGIIQCKQDITKLRALEGSNKIIF